ncbi:MAG: hypothetical protein RR435_07715, partial [Erysipelotrichaceae bacterium]
STKILYFMFVVITFVNYYNGFQSLETVLHILLFLSILGVFMNELMFIPSMDKYYAIFLLRMNAKDYALINFAYTILKIIVGYIPIVIIYATIYKLSIGICLLIPFMIAAFKLVGAALSLLSYKRTGKLLFELISNGNKMLLLFISLGCAYGLPKLDIILPINITIIIIIAIIICGLLSIKSLLNFNKYREVYLGIINKMLFQMDILKNVNTIISQNAISDDNIITSNKKGLSFLNEIFIERHKKILWKSVMKLIKILVVSLIVIIVFLIVNPVYNLILNNVVSNALPYMMFIMLMINKGNIFTKVLFMNCDHSLLIYPCYKEPLLILELFKLRLKEIVKLNIVPALIIGIGLCSILYVTGGTTNPINYIIIFITIIVSSVLFSVYHLMLYYLLQPYNNKSDKVCHTYTFVINATYTGLFLIMILKINTILFGILTIILTIIFCLITTILIYKYAPRTFKLKN